MNEITKHVDDVVSGDVIWFQGYWRTIGRQYIKKDEGMGTTLFGDSFELGTVPVRVLPNPPMAHSGYCLCECGATLPWRSDRLYQLGKHIRPGFLGECSKCGCKKPKVITKVNTTRNETRHFEAELKTQKT